MVVKLFVCGKDETPKDDKTGDNEVHGSCDRSGAKVQRDGESVLYPLFKVTRNYCHALHNARMSLLSTD